MLRWSTAGESHGEALVATLSGIPAGLKIDFEAVARELWRRQQGFGRGGRMKLERDSARFISGIRHGATIGSPIACLVANRDWENWREALPVESGDLNSYKPLAAPRPGHADLAGALKFNLPEARYVLERASARESAARVALGAVAKLFLGRLGIEVASHVTRVGRATVQREVSWHEVRSACAKEEVVLNCCDADVEQRMKAEVEDALRTGDTVGGVFEVVAHNVAPGLGSVANWDERLDARLAAAIMSVPGVKAVEIGIGIQAAQLPGSAVQDEIGYSHAERRFTRATNHAGGLEGGMSNGEDLILRGFVKPISTLRRPLASVDFATRQPTKASYERSDVCVVPAAGVVAEAMVALTLAAAALDKFGGDSVSETCRNFTNYCEQLRNY